MNESYLLESVSRAIGVFGILQRQRVESLTLSELARLAEINKTTTLRILRTLEKHGWVAQPSPGRYRAMLRFLDNRSYRVGYSARDNRLPFPRAVTESIATSAAAHGVEMLSLDNRGSTVRTMQNAQRMIREKVDLALVFQADSSTGPELSSVFNEAGIPFVSIDMGVAGASYFGADNYSAGLNGGRTAARALTQAQAPPLEEMILVGNQRFGSLPAARLKGFQKGFEKRAGTVTEIAPVVLDSQGSFETGIRLVRARMRSTRRKRGLVVCVSDPIAMGATQAIEESGRAEGWMVWSFGGGLDIRDELRRPGSPMLGAIGFCPEQYGPQLWNLVTPLLERKPAPPALFARSRTLTRESIERLYPHDRELSAVMGTHCEPITKAQRR
jgi:ribose transport system substrate-binding protein